MASALYGFGRQAFGNAGINWPSDTIKVTLIDVADYTVSIDVHDFYNDVAAAARVAVATIPSRTNTLGVMNAGVTTFTAVTGDPCEALVIWKDTGTEATSALIGYIDVATGLPVTPNGGDITITWDTGANKIFKL